MFRINVLDKASNQLLMSSVDDYMRHVTPQYIQLMTGDSPKLIDFQKLMHDSVIEPTDKQIKVIHDSEQKLIESFDFLDIDFNYSMNMIYTDGSDNVGMPYTKGASMIVPQGYHFPPAVLQYVNPHLVAHEFWHILSRSHPKLRKEAYKSIGFTESNFNILSNETIYDNYFINPDAIYHDHCYILKEGKYKDKQAYPILWNNKGNMQPVFAIFDNETLLDIKSINSQKEYVNQFRNVGYNTHPEEICAEHFRMMIMNVHQPIYKKLPNLSMMHDFHNTVFTYFLKNKRQHTLTP